MAHEMDLQTCSYQLTHATNQPPTDQPSTPAKKGGRTKRGEAQGFAPELAQSLSFPALAVTLALQKMSFFIFLC